MMSTVMRKRLGPIMGILLCLAATSAFAGEWVDGASQKEGWIYFEARGSLKEEFRHGVSGNCRHGLAEIEMVMKSGRVRKLCSPEPRIRAANWLVIGAKHGTKDSFNLTVDGKFRRALWNPGLWVRE